MHFKAKFLAKTYKNQHKYLLHFICLVYVGKVYHNNITFTRKKRTYAKEYYIYKPKK